MASSLKNVTMGQHTKLKNQFVSSISSQATRFNLINQLNINLKTFFQVLKYILSKLALKYLFLIKIWKFFNTEKKFIYEIANILKLQIKWKLMHNYLKNILPFVFLNENIFFIPLFSHAFFSILIIRFSTTWKQSMS